MSVLFPKVNKPREWDYRPIYYDKDKEARKEKLARLRKSSLTEEYERHRQQQTQRQSRRLTWLLAIGMVLAIVYYFLSR